MAKCRRSSISKIFFGRDFLSLDQFGAPEIEEILAAARYQKKRGASLSLSGKRIALLFEKPSLRTKVSFTAAIQELGGRNISLSREEVGLGEREAIADVARVLARYVDGIVLRTFSQRAVQELARHADVPVVNALTDEEHPCQALADLLTIAEHKGAVEGMRIAYVGDGNNVALSLAQGATKLGAQVVVASPKGYEFSAAAAAAIARAAKEGGALRLVASPREAVRGADVVYTDVWTSMGQEAESRKRARAFRGYRIDAKLMALAKRDAIFMHDLPAHRGEEVTDEVIDGPQSVVFDQAENRLHAQRALLHLLLGSR